MVSALEKSVGEHQGKYFTNVVKTHLAGKARLRRLRMGGKEGGRKGEKQRKRLLERRRQQGFCLLWCFSIH